VVWCGYWQTVVADAIAPPFGLASGLPDAGEPGSGVFNHFTPQPFFPPRHRTSASNLAKIMQAPEGPAAASR